MALWDAMKSVIRKYKSSPDSGDKQSFRHDWTDDELIRHARRALTMEHKWNWSDIEPTQMSEGLILTPRRCRSFTAIRKRS